MRRFLKWTAIALAAAVLLLLFGATAGGLWLRSRLVRSLPLLDAEVELAGLSAAVTVERDDHGVPTIRGANREDVARATGFVHAQERFFQMDLLRRAAAGELAALVGPAVVANDRTVRVHRFRELARESYRLATPEHRRILDAYAAGVNAGLGALGAPPPEYLALRSEPEPWRPEDVGLVVLAMYLDLQSDQVARESALGVLYDVLPAGLADFLSPPGTEWDAPLTGGALATALLPPAAVFDLRAPRERATPTALSPSVSPPAEPAGSNSWAVAGSHTADGAAWLANDMHLGLGMPTIWFRAAFVWEEHRVIGVTLPGTPPIVAGSNGHVAWGFTNSQADTTDLVVLEIDPQDPDVYRTPGGPRRMEAFEERIRIRDEKDEILAVRWTIWGPVIDKDHLGRPRAQHWIAHDPAAVDLGLFRMERAQDLEEALAIAAETRSPTQNCVVADRSGRIGWTLLGPLPQRFGHDGRLPRSWAAGDAGWDGWLAPADYPRVVDPGQGRIWTANNRVVDGEMLRKIGDGGFATGARAKQIRDDLFALERATPRDLLGVQLDDRALFLERWRALLLHTLTEDALHDDPRRAGLRRVVEGSWTGRASIDSAAYRLVRTFRLSLAEDVLEALTQRCKEADGRFSIWSMGQWEDALWRMVQERPLHLLDPRYTSWEARLLATVDRVLDEFREKGEARGLVERTWGERNTVRIQHPLSLAVPQLSRWLDIPPEPLPGDGSMPRVQGVTFGASERFVVSPGREESSIFHMPGGQSGHFLSPYYRKGHEAWARGEPAPFLPGPTLHRLTLVPPS